MLKLLLGRACTGKTTAILQTIAREARHRAQLLIVPEQHSHDSERRLCAGCFLWREGRQSPLWMREGGSC